ncbi:hypothetical protein B0H13DRAFT_2361112 [Mycena leptocephala]|nr:hypothetical protein B0H13DRAFT_2361112 [Mycena leptocephala]
MRARKRKLFTQLGNVIVGEARASFLDISINALTAFQPYVGKSAESVDATSVHVGRGRPTSTHVTGSADGATECSDSDRQDSHSYEETGATLSEIIADSCRSTPCLPSDTQPEDSEEEKGDLAK